MILFMVVGHISTVKSDSLAYLGRNQAEALATMESWFITLPLLVGFYFTFPSSNFTRQNWRKFEVKVSFAPVRDHRENKTGINQPLECLLVLGI
jgi:hypothetical protein